jgi:ubiquinone biosynthesis protein
MMPTAGADRWIDWRRGTAVVARVLKYGLFPFAGAVPLSPWARRSFAVRFRRTLEELGLTYLKLGQFLALRFDILPAEICRELNNLFENVAPMAPDLARRIVEDELQAPLEDLFTFFSTTPIAAASIGQVHEAYLPDGQRVAVKVQRAGIMRIFQADIRNLRKLTAIAQRFGLFGKLDATGMVDQFEDWTLREMDFRIEGRTAERVRRNSGPNVVIPSIYWHLTTARVLTMQFVEGVSGTQLRNFLANATPETLARRLPDFDFAVALENFTVAALGQFFTQGFFHGDPHPGNIMFLPQNRVVFLDFGIFGELNARQREIVAGQIENLAIGDVAASLRYYTLQVETTPDTDFDTFRDDCREILSRWYRALRDPSLPIEERHLARFTGEMIDVSRRNGLIYDLNYLLFWRAINNLNATLWQLQPDYDLLAQLRAFFERSRPGPAARARAVFESPAWRGALGDLVHRLPRGRPPPLDRPAPLGAALSNSARRRRLVTAQAGTAALMLFGISAGVIASAPGLSPMARATPAAVLIVSTAIVIWRRR